MACLNDNGAEIAYDLAVFGDDKRKIIAMAHAKHLRWSGPLGRRFHVWNAKLSCCSMSTDRCCSLSTYRICSPLVLLLAHGVARGRGVSLPLALGVPEDGVVLVADDAFLPVVVGGVPQVLDEFVVVEGVGWDGS